MMNLLPFKAEANRKKLDEILKLFDEHYVGEENILFERLKFYSRKQTLAKPWAVLLALCEY